MRRLRAAFAILGALPLLGGCDVDARAVILADDTVNVDITYWQTATQPSDGSSDGACGYSTYIVGVRRQEIRDPANAQRLGCHITGTVSLAALASSDAPLILRHVGGRYVAFVPAAQLGWLPPSADQRLHLELTFPGDVVAHDSTAHQVGRTLTWDVAGEESAGLWASSLEAGQLGPSLAIPLVAALGAVVGAAGVSGAWVLRDGRRRSRLRKAQDADAAGSAPMTEASPSAEPADGVPEDPAQWAPDADR